MCLRDRAKVDQVQLFDNLGRTDAEEAAAGDLVALIGLPDPAIGDTVADPENAVGAGTSRSRRTNAFDEIHDQQFAAGWPGWKIRHQPKPAGTLAAGAPIQRRIADRRNRRQRLV